MSKINYLIKKYNNPVPRYTSYPPANYFSEDFSQEDYIQAIEQSNTKEPENISIYIHIPFCTRLCHYCGCNALKLAKPEIMKSYLEALYKEIEIIAEKIDKTRKLSQIHYGGGTPNSIPVENIKKINQLLFSKFHTIEKPEIAIELNPSNLEYADIDVLLDAGFNRFSFGIQDFDENVLKNVNRKPSKYPVANLMEYIRTKSSESLINLDFIYGLPGQSVESFVNSLKIASRLKADRIVTFSYAHVPWMNKSMLILEKKGLPEQEDKLNMYFNAREYLNKNGYYSIGFDHYVLENDELYKALKNNQLHRNFQGYCTRRTTGQVYAFGLSAISQLESVYSQNEKSLQKYIDSIKKNKIPVIKGYSLSNDEIIIRDIITDLLSNNYLDFNMISKNLNITKNELYQKLKIDFSQIKEFEKDEILNFESDVLKITETGTLFVRNVAAAIDPAYETREKKYSRSV